MKTKDKDDLLPALDDLDLRDKQRRVFVETLESVNDMLHMQKKTSKTTRTYLKLLLGIFGVVIVLGLIGMVYIFKDLGWRNWADVNWPKDDATRRFNCSNGHDFDKVRTYAQAESFTKIFGGNCTVWHIGSS